MFVGSAVRFLANVVAAMLFSSLFLLASAHSAPGNAGSKENVEERQVSQRAIARWDAMIAGDYASAFDYISPGIRKLVPFKYYQSKASAAVTDWVSAQIESVACDEGVCDLAIRVTFVYKGKLDQMKDQASSTLVREKWLYTQRNWWLVPEKV